MFIGRFSFIFYSIPVALFSSFLFSSVFFISFFPSKILSWTQRGFLYEFLTMKNLFKNTLSSEIVEANLLLIMYVIWNIRMCIYTMYIIWKELKIQKTNMWSAIYIINKERKIKKNNERREKEFESTRNLLWKNNRQLINFHFLSLPSLFFFTFFFTFLLYHRYYYNKFNQLTCCYFLKMK